LETNATSNGETAKPMRQVRVRRPGPAIRFTPVTVGAALWTAVLGPTALAPEAVAALQAIASVRDLPAGSLLISSREPSRDLCVLARGDAALGTVPDDGHFHPERTVQSPGWLDASSAWLGGNAALDAVAVSDVQIVMLPRAALQQAMARHPDLARRIVATLARQVHALTVVAHDLMHKDAETRFADWLLQRCTPETESADGPQVVALHERKRDIAAQLAITPETLSRLLRQLSRKGLIDVMGYTVRVLDLAALRAIAAA
jgi:CRP-like cAMP-binding protein